jgi:PST family polysaccharide transporter
MMIWSKSRFSYLIKHTLVQNALSLYGVQMASYLVPLVTIPYLARVLGATGWGLVAFAQGFGGCVVLAVEYGFALSGTREVARHRESRDRLAEILAGVTGAKGLLAAASLLLAIVIQPWVGVFRSHPTLLWWGVFWALSQAFSMVWYFQGLERLRLVAALDVLSRALATVGIFFFIHGTGDEWKVLALQGLAAFLSMLLMMGLAYREVPFRLPTRRLTWDALRMGWSMFLFRGAVSLYTVANAFILGLLAAPQLVGYYSGAEKISRALLGFLRPISQSLYPRLSHLVRHARAEAARLARVGVAIMGTGGALLGLATFVFARLLVRIILGRGFEPAIPVLRVLAFLLPLVALSDVFGIQWMLPLGMDREFNIIIIGAGFINVLLALALAPRYAALGMAVAVVAAETWVFGAIYTVLRFRRLDPIAPRPQTPQEPAYESVIN